MDNSKYIAIVGAGFSGIAMGIKLLKAGITNFTIFEKSSSVGGTWHENTYPDCGCDVPSILYSFSFELYSEWDRFWAKQKQIKFYMEHLVSKYSLSKHIRLNSRVLNCDWKEELVMWNINIESHGEITMVFANYVVLATGALHVPQYPQIEGLSPLDGSSSFKGSSFHSANWDHNCSILNKRVGVVGSGASAIQIVPEIAKSVKELYVFQRSAPWVFYKSDFVFPSWAKSIFRMFPFTMRILRVMVYWATEIRFSGLYENSWMNAWMRWDALRYMRNCIQDPLLRAKVTPDEIIGCKRMLFSSFWYPALAKSNVHVVTNPLIGVNDRGLVVQSTAANTISGSQPRDTEVIDLDVIVYATGFQLTRGTNCPPKYAFEVTGKCNITLTSWMHNGPKSLLGITAPNFPNMFFLYGPNTNLAHNSILFMIECQVNYITKLLAYANRNHYTTIEVKEDAVLNFHNSIIRPGLSRKVNILEVS